MSEQPNSEIGETVKSLLELVNDSDLETDRRIDAAFQVANLVDNGAAVAALVELDESIRLGSYRSDEGAAHLKIARAIAKLGDAEGAVEILAAMCEDDDLEWEERNDAAQEILRMGDTVAGVSGINAVFFLASESGVDMGFDEAEYRIRAAGRMAEAGKISEAATVLKEITEDEGDKYSHMDHWNAALTLSEIGDNATAAKAFLSLSVGDYPDADDQERLDVALKVAELGDWDMASEALLSVAEECDREEIGLKAAIQVASFMDKGAERAIEIMGTLLSRRYSYHELIDARMERDFAVGEQTPGQPEPAATTDQEKAWALILEAAKILYPRAFND